MQRTVGLQQVVLGAGSVPSRKVATSTPSVSAVRLPRRVAPAAAGLASAEQSQAAHSERVLNGAAASTSQSSTEPLLDWSAFERGLQTRNKLDKLGLGAQSPSSLAHDANLDSAVEPSTRKSRSKTRLGAGGRSSVKRVAIKAARARARRRGHPSTDSSSSSDPLLQSSKADVAADNAAAGAAYLSKQAEAAACAALKELKRLNSVTQPTEAAWAEAAGEPSIAALRAKLEYGQVARQRLVLANQALIGMFARRYQGQGVEVEDLYQSGVEGLVNAAENFDPSRGIRLMTLAYMTIPRFMSRTIERMGSDVRLPVGAADALRKMYRVEQQLAERHGRPATRAEVALATGISEERIGSLKRAKRMQPRSLDAQLQGHKPDDRDSTLADVISTDAVTMGSSAAGEAEMWDDIVKQHFLDDLEAVLDSLPNRLDRQVLAMLYGLYGEHPRSLREVGEQLRLSKERVRQLRNACMERLKETGRLELLLEYVERR